MNKNRDRLIALAHLFKESFFASGELSMPEIIEKLRILGISSERRTIYADIRFLNEIWDYKITRKSNQYRVIRDNGFSIEEIQIITDALLSARFISRENTKNLLNKFYHITGFRVPKGTLSNFSLEDRVKLTDDSVGKNILIIDEAIKKNRKLTFEYWKHNTGSSPELVRKDCLASPYGIAWYEDFYYMLGNFTSRRLSYYRIDRMRNVSITNEPRKHISQVTGKYDQLNIGETLSKLVAPASGDEIKISLKTDKKSIGKVRDKFGHKIRLREEKDNWAVIEITVINNKELIPWILSFRDGIEVLAPAALRSEITSALDRMQHVYIKHNQEKTEEYK